MKYGRPVAGTALLVATLGGATAGALLLGTAGADSGAPAVVVSSTTTAASPGRCGPVLTAVVQAIGIPAADLRAAQASGQTLAQLAQANGVDPQVVIDAIVQAGTAQIDLQLARGEINEGQAALRKYRLPERASDYVNNPVDPTQARDQLARSAAMARAAHTIGVPTTELRAAMAQGQSIADVATSNGVDPAAVIDDLVAHSTERITAFVNGETRQRDGSGGGSDAC
ncbi:MAG TPA: hypothetical protein VH479_02940 [Acidimicrobiales bacterium]|jgi:hypothetical protein